ncbi:unnamed protein product [Moneuplotes crassus]|uniref:Uncharacterized protein n=1 Tax=Euplotes crassus TaxID=5936 RepID=A0AAD2D761_EUPCR|nr:unnamed protein product [Moneuplotes crassus]
MENFKEIDEVESCDLFDEAPTSRIKSVKVKSPRNPLTSNKGNIKPSNYENFIAEIHELFKKKPAKPAKSLNCPQDYIGLKEIKKELEDERELVTVSRRRMRANRKATKLYSVAPFRGKFRASHINDLNSPDIIALITRTNREKAHSGRCLNQKNDPKITEK